MSTKTSMMGLKVTYSFDNDQIFLSKSPASLKIKFGEMELYNNETRLIGVVKLRACIQSVLKSSPEILSSLASRHDYNIYVCDYSEIDTPLVGYGLLSKLMSTDYTDISDDDDNNNQAQQLANSSQRNTNGADNSSKNGSPSKQKDILIPGKVETNMLSLLTDNSKSKFILSVKLNFKKIDLPKAKVPLTFAKSSKTNGGLPASRKIVKPPKFKNSKRITNPGPAPKATRTLSLPVKPSSYSFVPPNMNITKEQLLSEQMANISYDPFASNNNSTAKTTGQKRKSSIGNGFSSTSLSDIDENGPKRARKSSPLTQSFSTFQSYADQAYLDQSLLMNSLNTSTPPPKKSVPSYVSASRINKSSNNKNNNNNKSASDKLQQHADKKGKNYWVIKDDLNSNKENIPPEILSELSDVSLMSRTGHSTANTSAPTSETSIPDDFHHFGANTGNTPRKQHTDMVQVNKELDELLNFNPDNFLANIYHPDISTHNNSVPLEDNYNSSFDSSKKLNNSGVTSAVDLNAHDTVIAANKLIERQLPSINIKGAGADEASLTPEDNGTPKDSDALTPIIELLSDKEDGDAIVNGNNAGNGKSAPGSAKKQGSSDVDEDDDVEDDDGPATSLFNDDEDAEEEVDDNGVVRDAHKRSIENKLMALASSPFAVYDQ